MKRNNYPNLAPTKISVPEYVRKELFKDGHVFILHNLMEDLYSVHLYEENKDPEFRYLKNQYNNDDLSHVNYISYEVPESYTSVFEVYEVYEYDSNSKTPHRIFYREDNEWQKKNDINLSYVAPNPGMFVVTYSDTTQELFLGIVVYNRKADRYMIVYKDSCYDIWNDIYNNTEKNDDDNIILLFAGNSFTCFNDLEEFLKAYYQGETLKDKETAFIHPNFKYYYERFLEEHP